MKKNSKFVRGKKKVREEIEEHWDYYYDMKKLQPDGWEYTLKVPYQSETDLDDKVYAILSEADSTADLRNCFIEYDISNEGTDKSW